MDKVSAVANYAKPQNKTELRSFLGLVGYYCKFIPDYSGQTASLSNLLRKTMPDVIEWNDETNDAFDHLKQLLCSKPILQAPDFNQTFTLQTDASKTRLRSVLSQQDDGAEYPVAFASRKLQAAEQRNATIQQKCLVIKWAVEKFANYLLGREFNIETDHAPLQWLQNHQHN